MRNLMDDARQAWRQLRRAPASSAAVVLTLSLGIGAPTAVFAVFNHVLFRPVPGVPTEESLITVTFERPGGSASALVRVIAFPMLHRAVSGVDAFGYANRSELTVEAPAGGEPTFMDGEFVSPEYLRALGIRARVGRLLGDGDAQADNDANVLVISERLWLGAFAGANDIVGQVLTVNGIPFVIVGVLDDFRGWGEARIADVDVWLPTTAMEPVKRSSGVMHTIVGRLDGQVAATVIEQQLRVAYEPLAKNDVRLSEEVIPHVHEGLFSRSAEQSRQTAMQLYWLLMAGTLLVLVLACTNAANLCLVRVGRRERDTAVRLALGGSRWRVARLFLFESLGLAALAAGTGLIAAMLLVRLLRNLPLFVSSPAGLQDITLDGHVVLFCLVVTVGASLAFGLFPAIFASRQNLGGVLGRLGKSLTSRYRLRHSLMIGQLALALMLLSAGGTLNRSLVNLLATDLGYDVDRVVTLRARFRQLGFERAQADRLTLAISDALKRAGFGVALVSRCEPFGSRAATVDVQAGGMTQPEGRVVWPCPVPPEYFNVLGLPLLAGRPFARAEHNAQSLDPLPVILNAGLARDLFGQATPVGQVFRADLIGSGDLRRVIVVGVAADTQTISIRRPMVDRIYHSLEPLPDLLGPSTRTVLVRSEASGEDLIRMRRIVQEVEPSLAIELTPARALLDDRLVEDRVLARLSAILAILAGLLAGSGVLAVVGQLVVDRTRDFGVRSALGASSSDILVHVLRGVLARAFVGSAVGLIGYWWGSEWLGARLFNVAPLEPVVVGAAVICLVGIAVAAAVVPARRAARVNPIVALRTE